jgi:ParB family transcriptional regulator, chromosome partitioning protein
MPRKKTVRRKKMALGSIGLSAAETRKAANEEVAKLVETVESDGGVILTSYVEPFGGKPILLVALPLSKVEPTPYQRDLSETHVKRLMNVIEKIGSFLDPIIVVRSDGGYWTPNGNHRLQALKKLGAKCVIALLIPESDLAYKILALNTEKAHNLREKSLEVIRMARALGSSGDQSESAFAFEFEEAPFLTLGICYDQRPRFSGGAYHSVLRRIDDFMDKPLSRALSEREKRAAQLLEVDDAVSEVANKLKARGLTSPYLKSFVVARVNPIRFSKASSFDFEEVIAKMLANAKKFNIEKVRQEDLASTGGPPPGEEQ